ncbi:alpha/beta hydrolase, partial [Pseudomonas aeruginosa]
IVSVLLGGGLPERIDRLALIDGLIPFTGVADKAPQKLGEALKAQQARRPQRTPGAAERVTAGDARRRGGGESSRAGGA